jgi:hypothetical protein
MVLPFKKILSKLEIPKNDWVLSRFGGCEPPSDPTATSRALVEPENDWVLSRFGGCEPPPDPGVSDDHTPVEEEAPLSQAPVSVAARILNRWFDAGSADDLAVPPQSCSRMSSNASDAELADEEEHEESRAS